MKKIFVFFIIMFICNVDLVCAKELIKFSKCVDGDTIKVLINGEEKTVRMLAIDTPESVHPNGEVEYYGKEASEFTCNKVTNSSVLEIEYDENSDKTDKYDRILGWIFVDGKLLQDLLVSGGYAEVTYLYGDYKYTSLLQDHQIIAESNKIGIWNDIEKENFNKVNSNNNIEEDISINLDDLTVKDIFVIILIVILCLACIYFNKKYKRLNRKKI